jgi:hypothetical protein
MISSRKPSDENYRHVTFAYSGVAPDAHWLVAWLNDPLMEHLRKSAGRYRQGSFAHQVIVSARRIETLIERLQELSRVASPLYPAESRPKGYFQECWDAVKEITDQYRVTHGYSWDDRGLKIFDSWASGGYMTPSEYRAHMAIRELVMHESFHQIVRCATCEVKWIVRWRKDRQFCSDECRRKHYESSPEGKERRREANRRAYLKLFPNARMRRRGNKRGES